MKSVAFKCDDLFMFMIVILKLGKQDPIVYFSLGGWSAETDVKENSGANVIWDNLMIVDDDTSADVLVNEPLKVRIYDKNKYRKDALIGSGEIAMKRLAYTSFGKQVNLIIRNCDAKRKTI